MAGDSTKEPPMEPVDPIDNDLKYVIIYKQPVLGHPKVSGRKRDIIWKNAEDDIEASDDVDAFTQMRNFIEQGALFVDTMSYQRKLIKLVKFFPFRVVTDFIPGSQHPYIQRLA